MKWWAEIRKYWSFVFRRKTDESQPVFPPVQIALFCASLFLLPIVGIVLFDGSFLAKVQAFDGIKSPVWKAITDAGKSEWILVPTGLIVIAVSILAAFNPNNRKRLNLHMVFLWSYFLFTSVAFSGILVQILKVIFGRTRPEFVSSGSVWEGQMFQFGYEFASFPSGHSTTAGAAAIALGLLLPRMFWVLLVIGLVIAYSRIVVHAHFPSDVIAGFLFGCGFAYFYGRRFAQKRLLFQFTSNNMICLRK